MMIILATLFDTILRVMKNILVNKPSKLLASTVNASLYLCNALLIKYIADTNTVEGLMIVVPTAFIGCWVAMTITDKLNNNKFKKYGKENSEKNNFKQKRFRQWRKN